MFDNQIQGMPTPQLFEFRISELGEQFLRTNLDYSINSVSLRNVVVSSSEEMGDAIATISYGFGSITLASPLKSVETDMADTISDINYSLNSVQLKTPVKSTTEDVSPISDITYLLASIGLTTVVVPTTQGITEDENNINYSIPSVTLTTP